MSFDGGDDGERKLGDLFGDGDDGEKKLGDLFGHGDADRLKDVLAEDLDDPLGEQASELDDLLTGPDGAPTFSTRLFSQTASVETGDSTGGSNAPRTVVDPSVLQLVGLGATDDHYLPDGNHLRWTFAPGMGFPRSGFRLYRRPSPRYVTPKEVFAIRRSGPLEDHVSSGQVRTPNGLRMSRPGRVTVADGDRGVTLNETPTTLRFVESDADDAPEMTSCWVKLDFVRRRNSGSIAAVAVGVDGDDARVQDRGGVGNDLEVPFEPLRVPDYELENLRTIDDVPVLEPHANGSTLVGGSDGDDGDSSEGGDGATGDAGRGGSDGDENGRGGGRFGRLGSGGVIGPRPLKRVRPIDRRFGRNFPLDFNSWTDGVMILNGSVIDEVRVTGTDAVLQSVSWLPVSDYAEADGWQEVKTFRLPIEGDGTFYPRTSESGEEIARERLRDAPPKALPAWDEPSWPPSPDPAGVRADQEMRYLGDGHQRLEDALDEMLETEMTDAKPQASVTRTTSLSPTNDPTDGTDTPEELQDSEIEIGLLDSVMTVAVDPQQATALGLATTDTEIDTDADTDQPDARFDYKLEADWPLVWWFERFGSVFGESPLDRFRDRQPDEDGIRLPIWESEPSRPETAEEAIASLDVTTVSVATGIEATPTTPVEPPTGLSAEVTPTPGESVPASVELEWDAEPGNLFTSDGHVAYAVRRRYRGTDEAVHRDDPDTGVTLPHVNATGDSAGETDSESGNAATVTDHDPPGLGTVTYRVSGMDVWGRFSDFAEVTVEVTDETAPPAPTGLTADLAGDPGHAVWDLELAFDWTAGQQELAPDTASFEILCEQGKVEPTTAGGSRGFDDWDRAEVAPGIRERIRVEWPSLSVASGPNGTTTWVDPDGANQNPTADARVHVTVPDVTVPFDGDEAELSVTVVAVDSHGNPPTPATPDAGETARRAVASRVAPREPTGPSMPAGPQQTTWPDAQGECHWTCRWSSQPDGSRTTVLRASQARLLSIADVDHEAFADRSRGERAERLRRLAADNQQVFSPDHQEPYDHDATEHTVSLGGTDRGWTVVTARHTGPTGTKSPWPEPDGFAVVAPRTARRPSTPRLSATPDADSVQLRIDPDPSEATANVRLYRTPDPDAVAGLRRMRPLAFPSTGGNAADVPIRSDQPTTVTDDVPYADRWYAYRAVAESESGERSPPTDPVWVRASSGTPPPTPTVQAVETVQGDDRKRRVEVEVEGYGLDLRLRRERAGTGDRTTLDATPVEDVSTVSTGPGVRTVEVIDEVPAGESSWAFTYEAVVEDRRGRTATSDPVTQGGNP